MCHFFKNIISLLILWELHIINTNSAHLLVPPYPTFTPKRKILKSNQDKTYTGINPPPKKKPSSLLYVSCLSDTFSFTLVASGTLCQRIYPFVHLALLAHVHCNESLVYFRASGFWQGCPLKVASWSLQEGVPGRAVSSGEISI